MPLVECRTTVPATEELREQVLGRVVVLFGLITT